ncbi:hypothetical protein Enr13x_29800 [Stieleria neptunia]|uniref:Uncharacterized protein n=2 Tax=Stieleria neptunia TaxID=2527979 RepID=A0A518HQJ9_9BACT|nr:hypothetical protein Enr13x_29800 [Stieleria neptunia]
MRLTLRTLLAYLDNTLEPQEAEILRQKVEQSGFATQLVQRIRSSVADPSLSAPAPDSVHPIEEPNMMSNFLDSTLPPEQIAEIEKACLESLPHLAEAAACHQILTMVLGRPAEVSDHLRERVIAMVDANGKVATDLSPSTGSLGGTASPAIAGEIGPRYSGIELTDDDDGAVTQPPAETPDDVAVGAFPDASSQPIADPRATPPHDVKPVGAGDSGVFQAATKLREQSHQFAEAGTALDDAEPLAGDRPLKQLERSDFYDGEVRTSRVTPWLVTLALVAILLFAISKIFTPLLGPQKLAQSDADVSVSDNEPDAPASDDGTDESASGESATGDTDSDADTDVGADDPMAIDPEMLPAPEPVAQVPPVPGTDDAPPEPDSAADLVEVPATVETAEPMEESDAPPLPIPPNPSPAAVDSDPLAGNAEVVMEDSDAPPLPPGMAEERIASLPDAKTPGDSDSETKSPEMDSADDPTADDAAASELALAKLVSENALVAQQQGESNWTLLAPKSDVSPGSVTVCGPEYRASFQLAGDESPTSTLVGPTEVRWESGQATVNLEIRYGRGTVQLPKPGNSVAMTVGETTIVAQTETGQAVLAFEVLHRRELGADPMVVQNHRTVVVLTSVAGNVSVSGYGSAVEVPGGSQVTFKLGESDPEENSVTQPPQLPSWIDPEVDTGSLESEAASDLLELVRGDGSDSLLLSLRVALGFRRNEVAALAGKTMLALGDASAYFGVDGLFSNPKQRLYWSSHLDAVRQMMDRSIVDAAAVRTAIAGQNAAMDNADGDTLFRLLIGYSQDQLETGGDAELVADLESASMPVRVLASEHLRDISGTTLFFKPEEEVASRREEVVKKWKVRLRKESIRYPETE